MLGRSVKPHDSTGLKAVLNRHTCIGKRRKKKMLVLSSKPLERFAGVAYNSYLKLLSLLLLQKLQILKSFL